MNQSMGVMVAAPMLLQLSPKAEQELVIAAVTGINMLVPKYQVNTPLRMAHFLAQTCHESGGFTALSENLNYSAERIAVVFPRLAARAKELARKPEALGNAAYAGRMGNGPEESGDGYRFRGRGFIQLTGKDNYARAAQSTGLPLLTDPGIASTAVGGVHTALDFWQRAGCNALADKDDVLAVTKRINGGTHGLEDRRQLTEKAKVILGVKGPLRGGLIPH